MYENIFKKIKIGNVELRNRTLFPPISTNFASRSGHLTERFIKHYARRAKGGVGLVIIENSAIDFQSGKKGAFQPRIDDYMFLNGWKTLVKEVHKYGAKISVELTHPGFKENNVNNLDEKIILDLIDKFGFSAKIAKEAGFDMVEVQGAHGLLVSQFLSPLSNKREDKWGERTLFAKEILKSIKKNCGKDFPVTIRLAVWDPQEGGIDLEEGKRISHELANAGYDMIQADIGIGRKELRLEPIEFEEGWRSYLAEKIRPLNIPVVAVGVIRTPEIAEEILNDKADMIALGRTLLADPDWVNKVKNGDINDIRKCIGCSECIHARHDNDVPIRCGVNPNVGNEEEIEVSKIKKNIVIIGGGPAGLEAAKISAQKGHNVYIFTDKFGGQLQIAAVPDGKAKIKWLIDYFKNDFKKFNNITIFNKIANENDVLNLNPDAVIFATGVKPINPFKDLNDKFDKKRIFDYKEVLENKISFNNDTILVGGGGLVGCETGLFLANKNKIYIVEMLEKLASGMETLSRKVLLEELSEKNVETILKHKIVDISYNNNKLEIILENLDAGNKDSNRNLKLTVDYFVAAFGSKPYIPFKIKGVDSYVIGDAKEVRKIVDAIHEGYEIAKIL